MSKLSNNQTITYLVSQERDVYKVMRQELWDVQA